MRVQVQYTATYMGQATVEIDEDALEEHRRRSDLREDIPPAELVQDFLETAHDAPHYWENGSIKDSDHTVDLVTVLAPPARLAVCLGGETEAARFAYQDILSAVPDDEPKSPTCPDDGDVGYPGGETGLWLCSTCGKEMRT